MLWCGFLMSLFPWGRGHGRNVCVGEECLRKVRWSGAVPDVFPCFNPKLPTENRITVWSWGWKRELRFEVSPMIILTWFMWLLVGLFKRKQLMKPWNVHCFFCLDRDPISVYFWGGKGKEHVLVELNTRFLFWVCSSSYRFLRALPCNGGSDLHGHNYGFWQKRKACHRYNPLFRLSNVKPS